MPRSTTLEILKSIPLNPQDFPRRPKSFKMSSKIPPLLEPYLALPLEASLILLTSVLGASTNWLVLRFLHSALATQDASADQASEAETKVLLVSFMRDMAFWKEGARRLVGVLFLYLIFLLSSSERLVGLAVHIEQDGENKG